MAKRLAVVIASYNHAGYIGPAIESVLKQTRPPDRFLVIDDGSRDDSIAVIRAYEKDGVEWIVQENAGAHATWNRCIETVAENCDLVSILNSDDIYHAERFERCLPLFERPDSKAIACTGLRMIGPEDRPLPPEEPRARWLRAAWALRKAEGITFWEWLAMANFLMTSSNIIGRADYLKANPFRPYRFNHDYFLLSGAALRDEIALVDEVLLDYRVHPQNNINTDPAPLLREMLRMHLDLYRQFSDEWERDASVRARFFGYMAASGHSISAFHAGLFQLLLSKIVGRVSEEEIRFLVDDLDENRLDELREFPNKALVNQWDGESAPQLALQVTEKLREAKAAKSRVEAERRALREIGRIRQALLDSRWMALGRLFGAGKAIVADSGKMPEEKLENLRKAVAESAWARLGRRWGCLPDLGSGGAEA